MEKVKEILTSKPAKIVLGVIAGILTIYGAVRIVKKAWSKK